MGTDGAVLNSGASDARDTPHREVWPDIWPDRPLVQRSIVPTAPCHLAISPHRRCGKCGMVFGCIARSEGGRPQTTSTRGIGRDRLTLRVRSSSKLLALGDVHWAGVKLIARGRPDFNAFAATRSVPLRKPLIHGLLTRFATKRWEKWVAGRGDITFLCRRLLGTTA